MLTAATTVPLRRVAAAIGVGVLVLVAGRALAQTQTTSETPDAQSTNQPAPDALRGPEVREKTAIKTLVVKDMSGKLEPLTQRPELAALDLLALTPEERKPIDTMFQERAAAVAKLLREHQELFLKIQAARQGGAAPNERRELLEEMCGHAIDLIDPPLADRVRDLLPESKRADFDTLVADYMKALADENAIQIGGRGRSEPRELQRGTSTEPSATRARPPEMSRQRQELWMLIREVARTLSGIVAQRREQMDAFVKAVDATPEQESKLRAIARASAEEDRKNNGERAEAQRRETWRKMMDVLNPDQRKKALELRRGS